MIARVIREIREYPSRWVLLLLFLFMFFPAVDMWWSRLFYIPGQGFTWDPQGFLEFVRSTVQYLILGTFLFCLVLWVAGIWYEQWFWGVTTPRAVYLMLTLLVGPGLIVEALLKTSWGRARPKDLTVFGGAQPYTPPLWVADHCDNNCSFVSGHAALAFWATAYAFFLPRRFRLAGVLLGVMFGFAVGFVRIAQGAHFMSDVIFAGVIVLFVNYALARVILDRAAGAKPAEAPVTVSEPAPPSA